MNISEKQSQYICQILYFIFIILIFLGITAFIIHGINATVKILVLSDTFRWIAYWNSLIIFSIFGIIMITLYRLTGLVYLTTSYIFFESLAVLIQFNPPNIISSGLLQYLTWYFTIFFILIFYRKFSMKRLGLAIILILVCFQSLYFISPTLSIRAEIAYQIVVVMATWFSIKNIKSDSNSTSITNPNTLLPRS